MEIALNSDTPGGFKHENAIASQNGLALLASITLKNALNINGNNNNSTIKNKNNTTKNKNNINHLSVNHNNKNNIKHHKAQQPQHVFISSPAMATSSLSSTAAAATISSPSFLSTSSTKNTAEIQTLQAQEQKSIFTFTTAGLQALTETGISAIESEIGAVAVDQQKQQPTLSTAINNHHTSLSTNHHNQTKNTLSAKDPNVALLEALSIKTKKKQNSSNQQLQKSSSSSSAAVTTTTTTTTTGSAGGVGCNNNSNNTGISNKISFRIPSDILDDLASRFIINVPDMELSNLIRICFQIELAHWFYLDFFCASEEERKLQPCGIKQFALQIFEHIPFLCQHLSSIDKILEDWKNYKLSVPTYGAILISEDLNYCLLVQSYFAKSSWGFPKGKVNENEDPVHCATREVYEETGYDITELIAPNDYIEAVINYQYTRLYIVRDVSLETKFSPRTRNEIKCCDWFPIDSLPVNKTDAISKPKMGINANSFFMIMPFVKRLKKWVNDKRNGVETRRKYSSGGSPTSTSPLTTSNMLNGPIKSNCKKQHKRNNSNNLNDDINALNNIVGGGGGAPTAVISNANVNCSNSNSNRSKRQRHKSMGDLDGIKLNNFNNCNNQSNCKSTNNNNNNSGSTITTAGTPATNNSGNISCNNMNTNGNNNNNNQKRHSKIVADGSNVSSTNNGCNNNNNNNNVNNVSNSTSKRQLFHSQSQTNNLQQNGEKIVSSFDLIRKEKQQMKTALAKAQKQQQNVNNNNGRQRAKSQSDKLCMQQQQKSTGNGSNNNSKQQQQQQQQRIQKQQSLIANNANMQNYNINNSNNNPQNNINNSNKNHNNNNNNINIKSIVNTSFNNKTTTGGYNTPTPPPLSGNDLLALAAAAAAAPSIALAATTKSSALATITTEQVSKSGEKPRPSSVSLHFPEFAAIQRESSDITATHNQMPQFQRMASGTNLRILKRSTSHQPTQQNQPIIPQPPQRQASALQFTPNFNSWTNFTFTKNFIANVFC